MKEPQKKSVPVDHTQPEQPIALLVQAVQYLRDEVGRLDSLATGAVECGTAYAQTVLVNRLAERIADYRSKGLQALSRIAEDLVAEHNARVEMARKAAEEAEKARVLAEAAEPVEKGEGKDDEGKAG